MQYFSKVTLDLSGVQSINVEMPIQSFQVKCAQNILQHKNCS